MKPFHLRVAIVVAGLTLAAGPALAQDPRGGGGGGGAAERTGGGGAAANSGGGNSAGGNVAGSSGGGSTSSGVSSVSSPSFGAASSPSISGSDRGFIQTAPQHRLSYSSDGARTASGGGQHATPRSSGSSGSSNKGSSGSASPRGSTASGNAGRTRTSSDGQAHPRATTPPSESNSSNANPNREVPSWARPRGDRPTTGTAVARTTPLVRGGDGYGFFGGYGGYYDPYGFGFSGGYYSPFYAPFGFGMAYGFSPFGFDPFGYGYYDPMGAGDPYAYGAGYGSYTSRIYNSDEEGALKLKVKPRSAKVYVDGYYVGLVDQFDGAFQKLALNGGGHKVEIRADGYETAQFDVLITPRQTITFAGDLKKIQ